MIFRVAIITILFSFSINYSYSQNLSFGADGITHADTLCLGDSIFFNFWLVNNSSISLRDSILVTCETFDEAGISISSMQIGSSYNSNDSLDPGDSLFISIGDVVTSQSFNLGDNIIVIWPASIGVNISDTSYSPIYILDCVSSILDKDIANKIFITYSRERNCFLFPEGVLVSDLLLLDPTGRVIIYNKGGVFNYFNTPILKPGIYVLQVLLDGKIINSKFFIH